ncbi:hypothetical protein OAG1_38780 [Agarivorans sp. OAG1]|uniref:PEP-CTERM sorting domain-containing protein n=1 Tax=unclassified Agarivorans TaxID=2636026 RepID=UPI00128E7866|nr:PEP-CTERM sorting domain-containing protein [Agarivorans sp. B2Z047]MPW29808.1 PEP-CTERM sorting domain-containing protein [Agarivorans sp. B2Z047]UQN43376.1 PEP-CTERM sorting domain-containing protein [Agarivorans sp. B2Z047]BEU05078.1 hypothetical protein OAG1_38780 [Agarivorans sp. OAG1]
MKKAKLILCSLVFGLLTNLSAQAGVILSAVDVSTNMGTRFAGDINNTIDQSGLNTTFVSGVTDFDTYNPSSQSVINTAPNQWWGATDTLGYTDFDLGAVYNLHRFALWNANFIFGVKDFRVLIDDNAAFSSALDLGSFTANFDQATGQVFDLLDGIGRYVRIEHLSIHSNSSNINEVAFDVSSFSPVTSVPEPSTLAIFGLAFAGLMFRRKQR